MATLVDSNVLIDLMQPESPWAPWSGRQVTLAAGDGGLVINQIVLAEISVAFLNAQKLESALSNVSLKREDLPWEAAYRAGVAHAHYRNAGGPRERVLPDFLIGAHAEVRSHRILTRDGARYRSYFPSIDIISPDTHP